MKQLKKYSPAIAQFAIIVGVAAAAVNYPAIVQFAITVGVVVVAVNYRRRLKALEMKSRHSDDWPTIPVPPRTMEKIESGKTMLYRHVRIDDGNIHAQYLTGASEFSDKSNEEFEKAKKERDNA